MTDASRKARVTERIQRERRAVLIVNCRSRRGASLRPRAEQLLRARGFEVTRTFKLQQGDVFDAVFSEALAERPPLLVVGSGDGTVATTVDHLAGTDTVLGYLPMGTTNNFARVLGIPRSLNRAVDLLTTGRVADVDLGVANGDHFANMASLGISVRVSDGTPHLLKRSVGRPAYALAAATALARHTPFTAQVVVDGTCHEVHTHQLNIANGAVHAGSRIAVDAGIDDGLLVAYPLGGPARRSTVAGAIEQMVTPHRTVVHKGHIAGRHVRVVTDPPMPVELDGETVATTPLDITVDRNALLVVVPHSFRDA